MPRCRRRCGRPPRSSWPGSQQRACAAPARVSGMRLPSSPPRASGFPAVCRSPRRGSRPSPGAVFAGCWRQLSGVRSPGVAQHLGIVIHAAAALAAEGADDGEVAKRVDELWQHLDFGSPWYSARQRAKAEAMVAKFLEWHRSNPRELVAVEHQLRVSMGEITITGQVDRLERDEDGAAIIVDLKTGTGRPSDAELDRHPQLGVYQLAVLLGRVRAVRPRRAGRGRAGSGRQCGAQGQRPGTGASAACQRPRPGVGAEAGRDGSGRAWQGRYSRRPRIRAAGSARSPRAAQWTSAAGR